MYLSQTHASSTLPMRETDSYAVATLLAVYIMENKMTNFQGERRSKVSAPNYNTRNDNQQENNKQSAKHNRHKTRHTCVTKIQTSAIINQTTTNKHLIITSACIFHRHMPRLHYLCAKQTVTLLQHCRPYTACKIKWPTSKESGVPRYQHQIIIHATTINKRTTNHLPNTIGTRQDMHALQRFKHRQQSSATMNKRITNNSSTDFVLETKWTKIKPTIK